MRNSLLGNYINCYVGYSKDKEIRWKATSGGIVSSLLIFLLKEELIDGALVTKMNETEPLKPETFIARSKEEVLSACGSKYCPVPINQMIKAMKEMMSRKGTYAIVGLPCHIKSLRKVESLNKKIEDQKSLYVGLFCSHTVSFVGTEVLLQRMGIRPKDVHELKYRGRGWPGTLSIRLKDGSVRLLPFLYYWGSLFTPFFFTPMGCILCSDVTNELADISIGDAWLPELKKRDRVGTSIVISRTSLGEETLRVARNIQLSKISSETVVRSQWAGLFLKKKSLQMRRILRRKSWKEIFSGMKSSPLIFLCAVLQLLGIKLSELATLPKIA